MHGCNLNPQDTIFSPKEFLPYWYFKKGSLWIYQRTDTTVQLFDTAVVVFDKTSIDFVPQINSISYLESRKVYVKHSDSNFWDKRFSNKAVLFESPQSNPRETFFYWDCKKFEFYIGYIYYANIVANGPFKVEMSTTIKTPVYTFDNSIPFINEQKQDTIYLTKGVGLSKFVLNNETWELVYYKVEL